METYEQKFHITPNKHPKTGQDIVIGSREYLKLVEKYGDPKVTSPKTGYKITVNKGEYQKLLKEGYTEQDLLSNIKYGKIKSPKTQRMITIHGQTYKQLLKEGYFSNINLINTLPPEILNIVAEGLDCDAVLSLLKTSKYPLGIPKSQMTILKTVIQHTTRINTSHFTFKQLLNICQKDKIDMVGGYTRVLLKTRKGDLYTYGFYTNGASLGLGKPGKNKEEYPKQVDIGVDIQQIIAGFTNSLLLDKNGKVYAVGIDAISGIKSSNTFKLVKNVKHADYIACFDKYLLFLDKGILYGLGYFENVFDIEEDPEPLSDILFSKIWISNVHTVHLLDKEGNVYLMGRLPYSNIVESRKMTTTKPILVKGITDIIQVSASSDHCLLLTSTGQVYGYGRNGHGQLGLQIEDKYKEYLITLLPFDNVIQILVNDNTSYILTTDLEVYYFGDPEDTAMPSSPTPRLLFKNIIKMTYGIWLTVVDIHGDVYEFNRQYDDVIKNMNLNLFNF